MRYVGKLMPRYRLFRKVHLTGNGLSIIFVLSPLPVKQPPISGSNSNAIGRQSEGQMWPLHRVGKGGTMEILSKFVSQNGRWGLTLLAPEPILPIGGSYYGPTVYRGQAAEQSAVGGITGVIINPSAEGFVLVVKDDGDSVTAMSGTVMVSTMGLQANGQVAVLNASPEGGLFKVTGYKGRSVTYWVIDETGSAVEADPALLVAKGVLRPKATPTPVAPPSPPSAALSAFLKKEAKNG